MSVRYSVAAAAIAVLATIAPAGATCVNETCVTGPVPLPGSIVVSPGASPWDSCLYLKNESPAPPDWDPNYDDGGPYLFTRTFAWGNTPGYGPPNGIAWDERYCDVIPLPTP